MTKPQIISASDDIFKQLFEYCEGVDESRLFERPENKWSAAEHIQHLIISTKTTTLAFSLPKFLVRLIAGTPNRDSRSFDEIKNRYYDKLDEGAKASGRFIPKPIEINYSKIKLLTSWENASAQYLKALQKKRTEEDLDNYLVRHPLLGRITLRELCYFSIFHTEHHLRSIQTLVETP